VSISRAVGEDVGTYVITPSTASDANYTINFVNNTFSITQKILSLTVSDITADNILNASEAGMTIPVTGTVTGGLAGDIVTLTINGNTFTGAILSDGTYSINVPGSDLAADSDTTVDASVTSTNAAGNSSTSTDTQLYSVDTILPVATLTVAEITSDNILNASEAGMTIPVTGTVTGGLAGDIVTLTINGNTFTGAILSDGTYSINVPGSDLAADPDTTVDASVTSTNAAGNITIATDTQVYSLMDSDGDGISDIVDLDSDNDGIPDSVEGSVDSDGDGVPDYLDLDSDNDGVLDVIESGSGMLDEDGDGRIDGGIASFGENGLFDGIETFNDSGIIVYKPLDTDGDGTPNYLDIDDDGDGISTIDEDINQNSDPMDDDTDGDGIANYLDDDDDNDGISTWEEDEFGDADNDGILDHLDPDATELIIFNQFSPNGDGVNDTFVINNIASYPNNKIEVFNRWGNSVYKKVGYDNSWDGTSNGRLTLDADSKLPVGTYYYLIELGDGFAPKTGWVYINR
jgi:gliding motility-associated-like protein